MHIAGSTESALPTEKYLLLDHKKILYYDSHPKIGLVEMEVHALDDPKVLDENTLRFGDQIIYRGRPFGFEAVDAGSFEIVEKSSPLHFWSRDTFRVFYNEEPLVGADPSTFEVLYMAVAKDAEHVYVGQEVMEGIDALSFKTVPKSENVPYDFMDKDGNKYKYRIKDKAPMLMVVQ